MANPTPPVRICVLRAGIKCCKGCQTKAKRKLLSVSGVSAVEYNAEQGLLTVSGDADPDTLLLKLTEWGKKAELVSLLQDTPPSFPDHNHTKTLEKEKKEKKKRHPTKCFLLRCFGKHSTRVKVEPYQAFLPPIMYPPPQATPYSPPPPQAMPYSPPLAIPYPAPCCGPSYTAAMFRPPPPSPPYYQTQLPHMLNSRLHYPPHLY